MKVTIISFLLIFCFCSIELRAQNIDSTKTSKSIFKVDNPYGKGRTKWLNSNGFNTITYNWNDPEINLYIDHAIKNRSTGNIVGITGVGILVLGLGANVMGRLAHTIGSSKPGEPYVVFKDPYYVGGILVASSIFFHLKAHSKLKKATQLR